MTYRKCRNPHPTPEGEKVITSEDIILLAIECFNWKRPKVVSWFNKENARLKKARPSELVDRGQGKLVVEFLESKKAERLHNEYLVEERRLAKENK